ncbi:hypothetical protein AB0M54_15480 [Actinoplanes sp. NPDC051470]|uniref:hypothetical protein n=1 Tax=unclassified Actinoplanes TaxID=2626549 RepID=UPI00343D465C
MALEKHVEFEVGPRTYRVKLRLGNSYDVHGFNALMQQVGIYDDLITGEKLFVNWSNISVIRFRDATD